MSDIDPIEVESYRILRSRIDLSDLPPLSRAVTERIIHATADFDYVTDLMCDETALAAGVEALRRGAPVVADGRYISHCLATMPEKAFRSGATSTGGRGMTRSITAARPAAFMQQSL